MKASFWLRIPAQKTYGNQWKALLPKISIGRPDVGRNEVAFKLELEIPDSYYALPELAAKIILPDVRKDQPQTKFEMEQRIAMQLKESLGVNVTFTKTCEHGHEDSDDCPDCGH